MAPILFISFPTPTSQPTNTPLTSALLLRSNPTRLNPSAFASSLLAVTASTTSKGNVSTPTADLMTVKCLLNSVVSTNNAEFITIDIIDFYLNTTPMNRYEYMRIPVKDIPATIMTQYKLQDKVHNGTVMVEQQWW
jgi:hypothetical protein